ncbi:hypothetical protein ACFOWM_06375 [Ferruginibacter yonginensis]|uniref:Outer membrane protein beta-barrel domain-containing protein n=1 Tax=Ferruginibacter yonginensis TaxID=1310416 RepID=A0ABV8QS62_9BACT
MEYNFTDNEFEQFLRESIEDYKMVPSRRVWYGIYNNVHPAKRWPSFAVCLLILTTFLYVGIANNNSISKSFLKSKAEQISLETTSLQTIQQNTADSKTLLFNLPSITFNKAAFSTPQTNDAIVNMSADIVPSEVNATVISNTVYEAIDETNTTSLNTEKNFITKSRTSVAIKAGSIAGKESNDFTVDNNGENITTPDDNDIQTKGNILADLKNDSKTTANKNLVFNTNIDKAWIEDFAFKNKAKPNKFKQNAVISYFITPSFGYRGYAKKVTTKQNNTLLLSNSLSNRNIDDDPLIDGAALNLEAGVAMKYKITNNIRLIAGVQANYTNYVSNATSLGHPTQTYLAVTGSSNTARYSDYATKAGNTKLNKTTIQVALPIGADYKIIGKGKLKWYVGSTLQPTYVLSGSALVLSNDGKNYISETPLLRRFNLNAAVETFATFKPSNNVTLSVGPQFRYQLLSTYKSQYNYTEKLYNVGVKIGITTGL